MPNGWVNLLLDRHVRKIDILNRGYSGYNTRWILEHIDELSVDFESADLVTILLGRLSVGVFLCSFCLLTQADLYLDDQFHT